MKKLLLASTAATMMAGAGFAEDVKVGIILGFTGPIESLTPDMAASAELALKEVSDSGAFLDGSTITPVRADSTCVDAAAASAAAERLITSDGVVAIMGADCSGVTGAVLSNVAVPNGVVMISPSATSPGLTTVEDNGLFFRTSPSDARQGEILAEVLEEKGISSVAVSYTNSDYGKGLADAFEAAFDGEITINTSHEDGKADYSAEIGALASAGGDVLVVLGYVDQGGKGIIQAAADTGAFDTFLMGDGMYGDSLVADLGDIVEGSMGIVPWAEGEGTDAFNALGEAAGINVSSAYTRESYDAGALIALAMAKGGEATKEAVAANVLDVANAPGEKILPGELDKALKILAEGGDIDYVGATNVELIGPGEAAGTYRYYTITDGDFETVDIR
ncbi:ABC transporter substrate-binding protein [Celeribacter halophilus]|uniref:Amino acid/amide ABC transporter substrate-binding protein, HAAT family (TC 3.A.1.4.-) n=1 Tax=Celeribacter halophilus TaxID=576117 RepID=A0A1I3TIG8_9RHOB|nr:ABC transporter substrate-binding protein [Celeribacter halophilus]PZX11094.1 branched-chain amino acid transport system substrate-binding protein [Celeribacter halophilus]SFJ69431.1 amino acid/amide ABC transporter substrate-binding protein, HAAT family (TC 3.A.1.4.-) [Celeribacter halophilus]